MERVYEPDWTTDARVAYTCAVADVLAATAAEDVSPSIQTAPLAFAPNVAGEAATSPGSPASCCGSSRTSSRWRPGPAGG